MMRKQMYFSMLLLLTFFSCQEEVTVITNSQGEEKTVEQLNEFFNSLLDSMGIAGMSVAIINDSKIAYHNTFGVKIADTEEMVDKNTLFEAASLSKPLFAYFAMKQVEKGLLDLDKPLYEYLPYPDIEYDERYKLITARMILSHSSGFPNWRQDTLTIGFEPGTSYMYSGEGYKYLAHVLAKINEVEFNELSGIFQKEIPSQINSDRLFFKWNDEITKDKATGHLEGKPTTKDKDYKDNDFGAAGGLHTEAVDYAKFLISLFENKVLDEALTSEMLKQQINLPDNDINKVILGASGWSLGLGMIPVGESMCYWHAGNNDDFQSWMHFYPDEKYGVVLFTNSDKVQSPAFFDMFFGFMNDGIKFDLSQLQ